MMVVDASTLGVIAGWPETKKTIAHWYQLGGSPGAGLKPFDSLYGATRGVTAAEVSPADPFAGLSTAAVDGVPLGAVLRHPIVVPASAHGMACPRLAATDHMLIGLPPSHLTRL